MGYLTKYGTQWGAVPQTAGNVFWVSPSDSYTSEGRAYSAADGNDGLSPERALRTIAQAHTNATASAGDVIMLLPGTHTSASNVAISKADLTFVGCHPSSRYVPQYRPSPNGGKVHWTSTVAGTGVTVTGADTNFVGIDFIPLTARTMVGFTTATRMKVIDCSITMSAAASTSTKGFVSTGTADGVTFSNLFVLNSIGAQGPCLDITGCTNLLIDYATVSCTTGSWAVGIQCGAGTQGIIRELDMSCSGTAITIGIDGTGVAANKSILMLNNRYGVSPGAGAVKNFTAAYVELVNNWYATVGGGAGFVISTVVA